MPREPYQSWSRMAEAKGALAISAMAERSPVAWSDYLIKLAKLYGYQEQSTVNHNHRLVESMSDRDIQAEIAELDQKRLAIDVPSIDISLNKQS